MTEIDNAAAGTPGPIQRCRAKAITIASRRLGKAYRASITSTRARSRRPPL
jgi:hypothetical protein